MYEHPLTEIRKTRPSAILWANMAVRPGFSWPNVYVEIPFEGKTMVLQPGSDKHSRAVSVYDDQGTNLEEGGSRVSRFLSHLAWSHDAALVDVFLTGSNNPAHPGLCGLHQQPTMNWASTGPWLSLYLPTAPDSRGLLALALYREGMGLTADSPPFSFLSFAKVLNIVHASGPAQVEWINANIDVVPECSRGGTRLGELHADGVSDVGAYLYGQGRCAVAHAHSTTVDPDDYADRRRLSADLPLMKEVAALFIEKELGIEREHTFAGRIRDLRLLPSNILVPRPQRNGYVRYLPAVEALSMD